MAHVDYHTFSAHTVADRPRLPRTVKSRPRRAEVSWRTSCVPSRGVPTRPVCHFDPSLTTHQVYLLGPLLQERVDLLRRHQC